MKNENAVVLLVDSVHGVNAWRNLASRYPLFVQPKYKGRFEPLADWLINNSDIMGDSYTPENVFNPDDPAYCENVEYLSDKMNLSVLSDDNQYWKIEQIEGDVWAVNPRAVWSDNDDAYVI